MTVRTPPEDEGCADPWRVAVAVLAKEPIPGLVKTRLCPPYSLQDAARLAAAALADTMDAVAGARTVSKRVLVLDGDATAWRRPGFDTLPQRGDGLDERLDNALTDVASMTGLPVLLVGMDTPQLDPALLDRAATALRRADAVLGLATDGGFWAIGVRAPQRGHCVGVPMSRSDTGHHQLRQLRGHGLSTTLLEPLTDVDDAATAGIVAAAAPDTRFARLVAELAGAPEHDRRAGMIAAQA